MKRKLICTFLFIFLSGFSGCHDLPPTFQRTHLTQTDHQALFLIKTINNKLAGFQSNGKIMDYERIEKGLGYSKKYSKKDLMIFTNIYTYNGGIKNIQEGIKSSQIKTAYKQTIDSIKETEGKIYTGIKFIEQKNIIIKNGKKKMSFKTEMHKAQHIESGANLISNTFITGYLNNILKVRISYSEEIEDIAKKAMYQLMASLVDDIK